MDKRLVRVMWSDAADLANGGWFSDKDVDDFTDEKVEVVSVGWIKSETKSYLTLVADYIVDSDGSITWGRPTKIPMGMVLRVEELDLKMILPS